MLLYLLFSFYILTGQAQGTTFTVKYTAPSEKIKTTQLDSIFRKIDSSLSLYLPSSRINTFNKQGWVIMDAHMKQVIQASLDTYKASDGAFDITSSTISGLWGFGVKGKARIPDDAAIQKGLAVTGSHLLSISGDTLRAKKVGLKIDCNGIAQGYTVDVISRFLMANGIEAFMVELGGEVYVKGIHPETGSWRIGVESVEAIAGNWYPVEQMIELNDRAVTTSGVNRRSFQANGKNYSHIIDPRKGRPVDNGILSVTVVANEAITADAWDNALMVMGIDRARQWLEKQGELEAYLVYRNKKGEISTYTNAKKAIKR